MFELANLIFSLALVTAQALNITLHAQADVVLPPAGEVAAIELSSAPYVVLRLRPKTEEERCRYAGIVVPYERTWEEVSENSFGIKTVLSPEPGKIAGYAVVVNRKDCEGRAPEAMFRVSTHFPRMFNSDRITEGHTFVSVNLASLPEDKRPKWVEQVIETASKAAETDPKSKRFIDFTKQAAEKPVEVQQAVPL